MKALPNISTQENLQFINSRQIMGMGGPWVGDMYLGHEGICKGVLQNNLFYNKNQQKLFFVQQHEGYFTLNYYDIEQEQVYKLPMKLEMAYIERLYGKKVTYYEAFNNKDEQYKKSVNLGKVKLIPLAEEEKPEDIPVRYDKKVRQLKHQAWWIGDDFFVVIFLSVLFIVSVVKSLDDATNNNDVRYMPFAVVLGAMLYFIIRYLVARSAKTYITRLTVIDDELHMVYVEKGMSKKLIYNLYDIKVDYAHFSNTKDDFRLVIYNWKKTEPLFTQRERDYWTYDLIKEVGEELSEFTPYSGRTS